MDWEPLLEGLEGDARAARVRLLDALHADGVPDAELRAAVRENRLVLLPIERALLAPAQYSYAELVERSGLPDARARERLRSLGTPVPEDRDAIAFGDDDLEALKRAQTYSDAGIEVEQSRATARVMTGQISRVAAALQQLFAQTYLQPGDGEDDIGLRFGEMTRKLLPATGADLDYLLRLQLRNTARSAALEDLETIGQGREVAVAFADIVGFTALGEELPGEELSEIAERLEALADEHVRAPARVVKTIGDAVMVVGPEPEPVVASMLAMVEAGHRAQLPPLRIGISYGRAIAHLGDWFGPAVNLASRLTARARRDSILTTNALQDALGETDAYRFSNAGAKRFKGIAEPVPVLRLRRADADAEA